MTACFKPYNLQTFSNRQKMNFNYIQDIKFDCNINKNLLTDIVSFMLAGYLQLTVIGYNNQTDEFLGKKVINNICLLNFTLSINSCHRETCEILIKCSVADEQEIKNLKNKITNMLKLYYSK
jgi:hypothetical protein